MAGKPTYEELEQRVKELEREVFEYQKVVETLRESEKQHRNSIENINDVFFATDEKGVITYISPPIKAISGYQPSEIIGGSFAEFIHQEDRPRIVQQFQKVLS